MDSLVIQSPRGIDVQIDELASRIKLSGVSGFKEVYGAKANSILDLLPPGPYFLQSQNIHQAWRLYPDELDAFVMSVVPDSATYPSRYDYHVPLVFEADKLRNPASPSLIIPRRTGSGKMLRFQVVYMRDRQSKTHWPVLVSALRTTTALPVSKQP